MNNKLFHIFSSDFSERLEMFGQAEQIWDLNEPLLKYMSRHGALNYCIIDLAKIVVASKYYDGEIIIFSKNNNSWNIVKRSGQKPEFKSFKEIPFKKVKKKKEDIAITYGDQGKIYSFLLRNYSIGLFRYQEKYFIHFSLLKIEKNQHSFGIEIFDLNGEYLGYSVLKKYEKNPLPRTKVLWKDQHDFFYMTETIDDIPVIKKFNLIREL